MTIDKLKSDRERALRELNLMRSDIEKGIQYSVVENINAQIMEAKKNEKSY